MEKKMENYMESVANMSDSGRWTFNLASGENGHLWQHSTVVLRNTLNPKTGVYGSLQNSSYFT